MVDGSFEHDPSENQLHTDESSIRTLVRFYLPFGIRLHVVSLCFAVLLLICKAKVSATNAVQNRLRVYRLRYY